MVTQEEIVSTFDHYFAYMAREFNPQTQRVDVWGNLSVRTRVRYMDKIPVPLGHVKGHVILKNLGLTILHNGPKHVSGTLNVNHNNLTSLAHAPHTITEDFYVEQNKLTTFDAPHCHVQGDLSARSNKLTDINGSPLVDDMVVLSRNPDLTNLQGLRPDVQHMIISYNPNLPLLRLLQVQGEVILAGVPHAEWTDAFKSVFEDPKYRGKGKSVMLNVALVLKKAGFPPTNVRW